MPRVLTTFTVVEDGDRRRQLGFRNFYESDGNHYVQLRYNGGDQITMSLDDFKKLMIAGEQLADLLAQEESRNAANETPAA